MLRIYGHVSYINWFPYEDRDISPREHCTMLARPEKERGGGGGGSLFLRPGIWNEQCMETSGKKM